jgi:uncharacterized protein
VTADDGSSGRATPAAWVASPLRRGVVGLAFVDRGGRPRIAWRLLAYLVAWSLAIGIAGEVLVGRDPAPARQLLALVAIPATVAVTYGFRRWVDRRDWAAVGLPWPRGRHLLAGGAGFLTGVAVIAVLFAVELRAGWVQVTGTEINDVGVAGVVAVLGGGLALQAAVGFSEELAFRGYLLANLRERLRVRDATLVLGVLFGLVHLPGVASPAFGLLTVAGGVAISTVWVRTLLSTGSLWAAIGMHAGWNWAEQWLLGLTTARLPDHGDALVHLRQAGPALVVGQEYQDGLLIPETGLLFTAAEFLLLAGYWFVARRRAAATRPDPAAARDHGPGLFH